ncbi:MAG: post-PEP-CTERM-1 domain-containing protein [Povalibacter sp.]|jgi:hypothetical protein
MKRVSHVIALAAMTGSLSITAWADPDTTAKPAEHSAQMSSMRVVRDAATGEFRAPTTEELKGLLEAERQAREARMSARSRAPQNTAPDVLPAEKTVVRHANGMVSVKLSQESLTAIKAQNTPNGVRVVHAEETAASPARMEK